VALQIVRPKESAEFHRDVVEQRSCVIYTKYVPETSLGIQSFQQVFIYQSTNQEGQKTQQVYYDQLFEAQLRYGL
jgi:hypothetical protein